MTSVGAMAVATSAAWVPAAAEPEGQPPLLLPRDLWLTPEPFAQVCAANPEAVLELTPAGQLITMTPTGGETGTRNSLLMARLQIWALQRGGWNVFASSSGFRLVDGSVPNPDASLMRLERWEALSPQERRGFPPLCSDLVVEVASASDGRPQGATALLPDLHLDLAEIWAG